MDLAATVCVWAFAVILVVIAFNLVLGVLDALL
jgi:hypothetical protein